MIQGRWLLWVAIPAVVFAFIPELLAQQSPNLADALQFSFSAPGARASGMGRTFIGIANDASAAVGNPAGLVNLTRKQLYLEYKNTDARLRKLALRDALSTGRTTTFRSNIDSFSFFNLSFPIRDNMVVAFTRHEFLKVRQNYNVAVQDIPGTQQSFLPARIRQNFDGVSYAGSLGVEFAPRLSAGITVSYDRLDGDFSVLRTGFEGNLFSEHILINENRADADSSDMGLTLGILYQPSVRFSLGATYSRGADWTLRPEVLENPGIYKRPPVNLPLQSLGTFGQPQFDHLKVPDRIGAGVSVRPLEKLLFGFDIVRVQYSDSIEAYVVPAYFHPDELITTEDFRIKDASEIHAGVEYRVDLKGGKSSIFLRSGLFTNPDHRPRFTGRLNDPVRNAAVVAQFNKIESRRENGITFGAGTNIGVHFQFDVAYVSVHSFDELVASLAWRF